MAAGARNNCQISFLDTFENICNGNIPPKKLKRVELSLITNLQNAHVQELGQWSLLDGC